MMENNIVLIGFMAVGKGRTARKLAEKTGMYAVDCDDMIESLAGKKVKKIFAEDGEQRFRQLERATADWLETHVTKTIISTGGGFFQVPNLREIGTVVLLEGEFNNIIQTIFNHPNAKKKIKKRPLLQDLEKAEALYNNRLPAYRDVADIVISVDDKETEEICDEIIRALQLDKTSSSH